MERIKSFLKQTINTTQRLSFIFCCFFLLGAVSFLLGATLTGYLKNRQLERYARELSAEIRSLQQKNEDLQKEIMALSQDPLYLERMIRRTLRMLNKDEIAIRHD